MELAELQRPRLELSGPKLKLAFEGLIARADEQGGVEAYVAALEVKSRLFREALVDARALDLRIARALCAHIATVRRRIGPYLEPGAFDRMLASPAATAAVRSALEAVPGVARVFTRDQIVDNRFDDDPIGRQIANSFDRERSGDVVVLLKP